jgi:hypothetical protein
MPQINFAFTIATVAENGRIATKTIRLTETIPYSKPTWWTYEPAAETSLEGMADRLRALAIQPEKMIVMGAPAPGLDLRQPHRRIWADPATATLLAPDRSWLPIDADGVAVPSPFGQGERLVEAALYVRDHLLPIELRGVRLIAVPTSSTGRKGADVARLRIFVALTRPHPLKAMKEWTRGAAAALNLPLDSSLIQGGQPIYCARPIFKGVNDPVPRRLHAIILDGERDLVALDIDRFAPTLAKIEAKLDRAMREHSDNWFSLIDATIGGDEGFHLPLTRGIGVAVRAGAEASEIQAAVAALLAARADDGRRKQYGHAWVQQAIASFSRRDGATRTAATRALSQILIPGGVKP